MKTIVIGSIFAVLALMVVTLPAFADHAEVTVSIPAGSSTEGCEATNECYIPAEVTIDAGSEVTWTNDDTAAHTVTSGTLDGGPDGIFDSQLFMAGTTFSHMFEEAGDYPYFCLVHPWMQGRVIVQEAHAEEETIHEEDEALEGEMEQESYVTAMTADGSLMIEVESGAPNEGEELALTVEVTNTDGSPIEHVNFDVVATQDGQQVLSETGQHSHNGIAEFTTAALSSSNPVDIQVTILGLGLPGEDANWTGPKGETVSLNVVPEFGPIVMIVLAAAIVSIVAITTRSKVIPRL
jgi:predicted secreted protein with PEFG-CTERM motif